VDDHEDPVPELRRIFEIYKREEVPFLNMMARRSDYIPHWDAVARIRDEIEQQLEDEQGAIAKEI
jgi:uncharacterized Ntn-hydrolase superfamily protein